MRRSGERNLMLYLCLIFEIAIVVTLLGYSALVFLRRRGLWHHPTVHMSTLYPGMRQGHFVVTSGPRYGSSVFSFDSGYGSSTISAPSTISTSHQLEHSVEVSLHPHEGEFRST